MTGIVLKAPLNPNQPSNSGSRLKHVFYSIESWYC